MRKLKDKAGLSLLETLTALLIFVLLAAGVGGGIAAGSRVYRDSAFETDSAALAELLNTALGDVLRYSVDVTLTEEQEGCGNFVFTSEEYGVRRASFCVIMEGSSEGQLFMQEPDSGRTVALVSAGAYPGLGLSDFSVRYCPRQGPGTAGGWFEIGYTITAGEDAALSRRVEATVRHLND